MITNKPSRLFVAILALSLLGLGACGRGDTSAEASKPPATKVKLSDVQTATIDERSEFIGSLESRRSVTLQPRIEGQVSRIFVKYGDQVPQGKALIEVDPARQQATVNSNKAAAQGAGADLQTARATLSSLEAQRRSRIADVKYNQLQYQRYTSLAASGAVPQQQRDQYRNSIEDAKSSLSSIDQQIAAQRANVAKAENAIQQAQANTKQEQVQLGYYTISAPFTGTVGDIPVKVGDYVNTSTQLTTITQNRPLEVNISIPIEDAPKLRLGMPVELTDGQGRNVGTSKVFFIAPRTNNNTQSVLIKSLFDNSNNQLRADQYVRAQVIWDKRPGVLIPTTAVSRIGGQSFVFVAQSQPPQQGQAQQEQAQQEQAKLVARQKPVELGEIRGNNYQVISGLKPGEKLVVSGILTLSDGAAISPES